MAVCFLTGVIAIYAGSALAQGTAVNTTSESGSSEVVVGSTPSVYLWVHTYIGPATIRTGGQTGCTAATLPPAGCTLSGGSGTTGSPLAYNCSGIPPLTGCSGGSLLTVVPGGEDIDTFVFSVSPTAQPPATAQAVPLDAWIPIVTGILVLLFALSVQQRGRR